jgi:hypothetical protein
MRFLLHVVRGPTSFANLHTVNGQQCVTFREACSKRGLLEDYGHWDKALEEAAVSHSAAVLRSLFADMIVFCGFGDGRQLWGKYESFAVDVFLQVVQHSSNQNVLLSDAIVNQTIILLEGKVLEIGGQLLNKYGLPTPHRDQHLHIHRQTHAS